MLVLTVTSLDQAADRTPDLARLHWAGYLCWPVAVVHGFGRHGLGPNLGDSR